VQEAFDGDAYAVAFRRAADELRAEGIAVASDPATGLPIFDDAVLSDPRVVEILAPTTKEFVKDTFQTMEIVTKLTKTGDEFSRLYEESKALGVKGNIKDAEAVISRGLTALMTRKDYVDPDYIKLAMQISPSTPYSIASGVLSQMESRASLRAEVGKKSTKATSILTDLARVFDPRAEETTRIEFALGTFQGDFNQHLRIPIGTVPEQYRPAYLAILGKPYAQAAQAASSFISTQPGQTPTSYSVFFRGRVDPDFLGQMAKDLSAAGHEANVSIRPNGIVVDVMPQFGNAGPVPINPTRLKQMADATAGDTTTASVIDRDFSSIYLERTDYAREINKGKKGLLNDTATEIQKITGSTRAAARDFASGTGPELSGNKAVNRRAEKARDRYRQRVRQLESVETRIRDMAKEFERDMARASKVMQGKLERQRKAKGKPAEPAPEGLEDL
jgi:TolA-binding protein